VTCIKKNANKYYVLYHVNAYTYNGRMLTQKYYLVYFRTKTLKCNTGFFISKVLLIAI